jgi:hypothetical protein
MACSQWSNDSSVLQQLLLRLGIVPGGGDDGP